MEKSLHNIGPYRLIREIGRGTFGIVWEAEKQTAITTTKFAVKLPRNDEIDLETFKKEAAIWVRASGHENVVSLIEADVYDGQIAIVSEYVPDGSLTNWLKQQAPNTASIHTACKMIEGILAGLSHLHERGIVHRDLKPDNVLLRRKTPMLTDFGIARLLVSSPDTSTVGGTPAYMAPEAFDGKRTEQTYIWAVGVIFYELLRGELPYPQKDHASFIGAIMRFDPPSLPEWVHPGIRKVVMKALSREPNHRYVSALEMRNDLGTVEQLLWVDERRLRETPTIEDITTDEIAVRFQAQAADPPSHQAHTAVDDSPAQQISSKEANLIASAPPNPKIAITGTEESHAAELQDNSLIPLRPSVSRQSRYLKLTVVASLILTSIILSIKFAGPLLKQSENQQPPSSSPSTTPVPTPFTTPSPQHTKRSISAGVNVTNKFGIQFIGIPNGEFKMGPDPNNGGPAEQVIIRDTFYLGKYEVTQRQWQAIMGTNPSYFKGEQLPVEQVSWKDVQAFIQKLNSLDDEFSYRLPTEAEWEYSCHAGTASLYSFGNTLNASQANIGDPRVSRQYGDATFPGHTMPVGSFRSNAFGLYDMHGNVREWCEGEGLRGGIWCYNAYQATCEARRIEYTLPCAGANGFRLVAVYKN